VWTDAVPPRPYQPAASLAQATLPDEFSRDAGMMSEIVIFLGGIATGVATNALYDMIKEYVARLAKNPKAAAAPMVYKDIEIHETQQADGTKVLQVVMKSTKK